MESRMAKKKAAKRATSRMTRSKAARESNKNPRKKEVSPSMVARMSGTHDPS